MEMLLNATVRYDASGTVSGVVGIGQDITGRKETETELDNVAKDLTNLIDTANAPIFGIDQLGRVNEWNQKAAEITEYSKDEVMGRNLVQEFITDDPSLHSSLPYPGRTQSKQKGSHRAGLREDAAFRLPPGNF